VVGSLAAGLPEREQKRVIVVGTAAALVLRVGFALLATYLLHFVGVLALGGALLLWVAWRMWRELRAKQQDDHVEAKAPKSFGSAVFAVALADLSMSLDNVLGVAGAARDHPAILVFGLVFSVAVMGVAANLVARLIDRYRWIAWLGLAVILWVACTMLYDGFVDPKIGLLRLVGVAVDAPSLPRP
jgi:YjbE family integral membrane protein